MSGSDRLFVNLHFLKSQSAFIYNRLYLSTKDITTIGVMKKGAMPFTIYTPFCDNLMLPFLNSSSNILSHLATLNVSLTFPFCAENRGERAIDLALAGQTSSATCIFFGFAGAKKHSASCAGDGMQRLWCAIGGVKCEDCAQRAVPYPVYAHPDDPTLVIGRSVEGPDNLVLYLDHLALQGFAYKPHGRLGVTPYYPFVPRADLPCIKDGDSICPRI
jgi:hypothetical protein